LATWIPRRANGADEALMLDPRGFVATCNSTNFFIVRNGELCLQRVTGAAPA
jgi:branched-subunit amino acid aminotransferase/4-amino-4-deoxychorismate lyase